MLRQALIFIFLMAATPLAAQEGASFSLGGDQFLAGRTVDASRAVDGDVFAAGNSVTVTGDVGGSAHLAGRKIIVNGQIGTNLYAGGFSVDVNGAVSGNATLTGNSIRVDEPVSGNLRAMGADVYLRAPVAGSAILGGDGVVIDAAILGDLALGGSDIDWGESARVDGTLHLYVEEGEEIEVPARVATADRVEIHPMSAWDGDVEAAEEDEPRGFWARLGGLFGPVLITGVIATALAALAPGFTASLRERALAQPGRTLWIGALGLSAVTGATVVLAITGIGIFVAPLAVFAALALGAAGYVVGAYLLGVWAMTAVGQEVPQSTLDRAIAAFVGAGLLTIASLIPFVGWPAVVAVLLVGVGGLVIRLFEPAFFARA